MLKEKYKQKAMVFAVVVYCLLGGSLVYLLFLNFGLELASAQSVKKGETVIAVGNSSFHIINDVRVFLVMQNGDKNLLLEIEELLPDKNALVTIAVPENASKITVLAEAPFHVAAEKTIVLEKTEKGISYFVDAPATVFKDKNFSATVKICNQSKSEEAVTVDEMHTTDFFAQAEQTKEASVQGSACIDLNFSFSPLKEGETAIYFNIKGADFSDAVKKELAIVGG